MRYKKLTKDLVKLKEERDKLQEAGDTEGLETVKKAIKEKQTEMGVMSRRGGGSLKEIMALKKKLEKVE